MKLFSRFLIQAIIGIVLPASLFAQNNFSISGNYKDPGVTTANLIVDKTFLHMKPETISVPLQNGHFEIATHIERDYIFELVLGFIRLPLYAEPGNKLAIDIVSDSTIKINLSGTGAEQNEFLQNFFGQFGQDYNDSLNSAKMLISTIDAYENEIFKQKKAQVDFLKNANGNEKFSKSFNTFMQNQISYHYWQRLLSFPITNANSNQKILIVNPLPEVMLEDIQKVQLNNDAALVSDAYRDFIKYYVIYFTSKANSYNKFTDPSISADRKQAIAREKLQGSVYLYWLSRFITEECSHLSPFMVKKMNNYLKDSDPANQYYQVVKAYADTHVGAQTAETKNDAGTTSVSPGKSDELDLVDGSGKSVSLSDFKGKVVYIDFWASWCGPCRMMMPFSKKLHEDLSEKQKKEIVFLYISIDGNKDAWQKAIQDIGISGVNVISPGNWSSQACKYFQINSIPRYMIMNKKGDIVNFNAPRPNDPELLNELSKYSLQ